MRTVNVNKTELIEKLKTNREKHIQEFDEAVAGYKDLVLALSQANLKIAKTKEIGQFSKIKTVPPAPVSYAKEYDKALSMLKMSIDETVVLEDSEFAQLVLDEWIWKHQFVATSAAYKAGLFK